jgi:hypothetical protein
MVGFVTASCGGEPPRVYQFHHLEAMAREVQAEGQAAMG